MRVRAARSDDVAEILALWRDSKVVPGHTDDAPSLGRLLEHTPGALLVAEEDGRIVGSLIAAWDGWRGNMYGLAVLPQFRRAGVGNLLVREGESRLLAEGARRVTALVYAEDERAVSFWEAAGYRLDEGTSRHVKTLSAS
jgi:ribosomal protein S18 acetylase RimI-like enzyme